MIKCNQVTCVDGCVYLWSNDLSILTCDVDLGVFTSPGILKLNYWMPYPSEYFNIFLL